MAHVKRLNPTWWLEQRERALGRDGYQCCDCGESGGLHVHHIVFVSKGGGDELGNLESLCYECHYKRHPNSWNHLVVVGKRQTLARRREALAALYERFISALYGQERFPCDVVEGVLLVDDPAAVEAVIVSPEPECRRWHVGIETRPETETVLKLEGESKTEAGLETKVERVSQPIGSIITHNLSPEEIAKAF